MSLLEDPAARPRRDDETPTPPPPPPPPAARRPGLLARPELLVLLGVAAVLNLWALGQNGWANEYYAAAVRSMASSWHDFLYGSFDPAGVMTVDKPPLALWVQALSVRIFGFHSLSILVPQALMGMATVALAYDLTRRRFGRLGGFVAGLALAITPMTVAISRHNNPDAMLVLCCVAALWCAVRGLEDGRTRWIVLAGVCVGLGFEAKMGAALLVVPALAAAWLWGAPRRRGAALRQLGLGGAAMVIVGGAWPLLVALTPAGSRPWISGTSDNSIWSLITGYNGLGRLDGQAGGPQAFGGGGGNTDFGGAAGPLRLLNQALGGQAGWLLGFAVVAGIAVLVASRLRRRDPRTGWLIAAGGSFATIAVAFSAAQGIFHPYYVSELAPFTAVLVGAGAAELAGRSRAAVILAPVAVLAGVLVELKVLGDDSAALGWLPAVLVVGGIAACVTLIWTNRQRVRRAVVIAALALLAIAPAVWAADTLGHATSGTFPAGGPVVTSVDGPGGGPGRGPGGFGARFRRGFIPGGPMLGGPPPGGGRFGPGGFGGGGMFGGGGQNLTQALAYAKAHGGGTVAVSSQTGAASAIIDSGADVAGIGGFSGRESAVTANWLADAVSSGQIRWVLTQSGGGFGGGRFGNDGRTGSTTAMAAVQNACTPVISVSGLYDCQGQGAALAGATS
jgi:4-amino-4-deoxy-L-arabinose transferase-like glycosyltransferase